MGVVGGFYWRCIATREARGSSTRCHACVCISLVGCFYLDEGHGGARAVELPEAREEQAAELGLLPGVMFFVRLFWGGKGVGGVVWVSLAVADRQSRPPPTTTHAPLRLAKHRRRALCLCPRLLRRRPLIHSVHVHRLRHRGRWGRLADGVGGGVGRGGGLPGGRGGVHRLAPNDLGQGVEGGGLLWGWGWLGLICWDLWVGVVVGMGWSEGI